MTQIRITGTLKAGDTLDIFTQYYNGQLEITLTTNVGRVIKVGHVINLTSSSDALIGNIKFKPGKHVHRMKGKMNKGFTPIKVDSVWVLNKHI